MQDALFDRVFVAADDLGRFGEGQPLDYARCERSHVWPYETHMQSTASPMAQMAVVGAVPVSALSSTSNIVSG